MNIMIILYEVCRTIRVDLRSYYYIAIFVTYCPNVTSQTAELPKIALKSHSIPTNFVTIII